MTAHQLDQTVMDNFNHLLARCDALEHFFADRANAHIFDKITNNFKIDIRLQKSHADFLQGRADTLLVKNSSAFEFFKDAFELLR